MIPDVDVGAVTPSNADGVPRKAIEMIEFLDYLIERKHDPLYRDLAAAYRTLPSNAAVKLEKIEP
ncbi:MAG TPA: hypothetical protein VFG53_01005 [Anaeromyxobacter sp.]|nr:hypothetical protein [Anaeromyxobacter sp.]